MNVNQCKKWMAGIQAAGITMYQFDTDLGTHLMNDGENSIAIPVDDLNAVIGIRSIAYGGSHTAYKEKVQTIMSDYNDIHEVRTCGTSEQILKLVAELGVSLSEDQVKIVVNIDKRNYDIKPMTGNYNGFKPLTQKQYEALSESEKAKYNSEKAAYEEEKAKYIGQNMAASVIF